MKRLLIGMSILSLLLIGTAGQKAQAQDIEVSYQDFYDNLAPYGQWVYDPQYGNVWVPNEDGDFRPYGSRGHWVMTDYGNTWVSEDPWGWACYHYGRWTYDPYYGWVWIPGYEWAPAWVTWRYGGGYSGWAPLGPGITIGVSFNCPESWWIFMEPHYMYERDCFRHWRGPAYNSNYFRQTTIINNYYMDNRTNVRYNYGPRCNDIERVTHQPVQVYRVSQTSRPGAPSVAGNRVSIYRPVVQRNTSSNARPGNVIQAPRAINSRPQSAANIEPNRQPQFRQEMQRQNANNPGMNRQPANTSQPGMNSQAPQRYNQPAPQQNNPDPRRYNDPANQRYNQPAPQQNSQEPRRFNEPTPQQNSRPEPQKYQQPAPQQNSRPEPQRYQQPAPQQNSRPEPQRYQQPAPQQNSRPEPQRYQQPAPPQNSRPEPQRYQQPAPPPQNSRPEPQRYQQPAPPARSQPAPAEHQSTQRENSGPMRR